MALGARPSSEEISKGCTKRIKLYHCDPFNFGEVTLSATGKLEIALVQMVPLAELNCSRTTMRTWKSRTSWIAAM